jgi:hypothetical protein
MSEKYNIGKHTQKIDETMGIAILQGHTRKTWSGAVLHPALGSQAPYK